MIHVEPRSWRQGLRLMPPRDQARKVSGVGDQLRDTVAQQAMWPHARDARHRTGNGSDTSAELGSALRYTQRT